MRFQRGALEKAAGGHAGSEKHLAPAPVPSLRALLSKMAAPPRPPLAASQRARAPRDWGAGDAAGRVRSLTVAVRLREGRRRAGRRARARGGGGGIC